MRNSKGQTPKEVAERFLAEIAHLPPEIQRWAIEVVENVVLAQEIGHIPVGLSAEMRDTVGYTWALWLQHWKDK